VNEGGRTLSVGEDRPVKENRAANKRLAAELASAAQTSSPAPKAWWRAFGFSREWREDGFVVAYTPEDAARAGDRSGTLEPSPS